MRWYSPLYMGESVKNSRMFYKFKLEHTKDFTGVYCIVLSETAGELLEICSGENLRRNYRIMGEPLIVGLAGTRHEAFELTGQILLDIHKKTGGTDVHGFFGKVKEQ